MLIIINQLGYATVAKPY